MEWMVLTALFMELDVEVCEEARGTDDDEWRVVETIPKQVGERVKSLLRQVMGNDQCKLLYPLPALLRLQELLQRLGHSFSIYTLIKLCKQGKGFFCTVLADGGVSVEEEVVACICRGDRDWVEEGEVTDAGEDEVLEDGGGGGGGGEDESA